MPKRRALQTLGKTPVLSPDVWSPPESDIQVSIREMLDWELHPRCWYYAVPNQRGPKANQYPAYTALQIRMGLRSGMVDLVILAPRQGFVASYFMEVKRPGEGLSDVQKEVHGVLKALGGDPVVVSSLDEARKAIQIWGLTRRTYKEPQGTA